MGGCGRAERACGAASVVLVEQGVAGNTNVHDQIVISMADGARVTLRGEEMLRDAVAAEIARAMTINR